MRLATKTTLALTAFYLALVAGLGFWVHRSLGGMARQVIEATAGLVGREIAVATTESTLGQLLDPDRETRLRTLEVLHRVSRHSEVVGAIAVVGEQGEVLASGDFLDLGRRYPTPWEVFGDGLAPRVMHAGGAWTEDERWEVLVPLARAQEVVGYLRIALRSDRLAAPYASAQRELWLGAAVGLVALGALGLLVHLQTARRGREVARALEHALEGAPPPTARRDEFSLAFDAARRAGQELQQARGQSAQAQQRLSVLSQVVDVGVLLVGPGQELEFANPRACVLLGAAGPEELAREWPRLRTALAPVLTRTPGGSGGGRADVAVEVEGQRRQLRCQSQPLNDGDGDSRVVLLRDRALLEALETDLCLATQLRGLTHLYRALTHDLRAPLNSMVLNLELLRGSLAGEAGPGADDSGEEASGPAHYVEVLRQEIDRLNRSLQDLLSETAPAAASLQEFDLRELVGELQRLLAPQARQQRVELTVSVPPEALVVAGRRDRVKQAALNLAINALEAMPGGGRLGIQLGAATGGAVLAVADSGPGIPEELRQRIFDMHFTTKTSGTGIGLYVARAVVEGHGGELEVESEPGRGTVFRMRLPLLS